MPCLSDKVYLILLVFMWADRHNRNVVIGNKKNGVHPAKSLYMWDIKIVFCTLKLLAQGQNKYERKIQREKKIIEKENFIGF
jgi:hypothetical protein